MAVTSMRLRAPALCSSHHRQGNQVSPGFLRGADNCIASVYQGIACAHRDQWHTRSAACCQASSSGRIADPIYMKEYQHLKDNIIGTARKAGGGLAAYLLIAVDGEAGLCALIGSAACNLYLILLYRDVDSVTPDTRVALWEAEKIRDAFPRTVAKIFAAYGHALRPRLMVPIVLAALAWTYNNLALGPPLDTLHQGCMLAGFLSYKIPLVIKIADENLPKAYKGEEMNRPLIERFGDDLDQWGRPKKAIVPLPTEVLPDNVDTSQLDLERLSVKNVTQMMGFKLKAPEQPQEQQEAAVQQQNKS